MWLDGCGVVRRSKLKSFGAVWEVWKPELRGLVASSLEILGSFWEKWDSQSVSVSQSVQSQSVSLVSQPASQPVSQSVKSASQVSVSADPREF